MLDLNTSDYVKDLFMTDKKRIKELQDSILKAQTQEEWVLVDMIYSELRKLKKSNE